MGSFVPLQPAEVLLHRALPQSQPPALCVFRNCETGSVCLSDSYWQRHLLGDVSVKYQLFSATLFTQWAKQKSLRNNPQTIPKQHPPFLSWRFWWVYLSYLPSPPTHVRRNYVLEVLRRLSLFTRRYCTPGKVSTLLCSCFSLCCG